MFDSTETMEKEDILYIEGTTSQPDVTMSYRSK